MALIKCPECGGEVSSNADTCVHCGCRYSFCPECGAVHIGSVQRCPACGYGLGTPSGAGATGNNDNFTSACKRRAATDAIIARALKITYVLSCLGALVLTVMAFVVVFTWNEKSLEELLQVKSVLSRSHGLTVAACTFFVIGVVSIDLRELYFQVFYARWLGKFKIDVVKYLRKDNEKLKASFIPDDANITDTSTPAYLTVVPHDASVKIFKAVARTLSVIGCSIALGYFITQNCDAIVYAKLNGQSFE
ncbi:MAG: zinc ribbon domain-containing protein, partial [Clostridia bacterium]|nr:zinc ribbon domain-containing protein [Clostridia bacterium]